MRLKNKVGACFAKSAAPSCKIPYENRFKFFTWLERKRIAVLVFAPKDKDQNYYPILM